MKTKGEKTGRPPKGKSSSARDPTPPVICVKADSKGLAGGIDVKADSKEFTTITSEVCSR
jgi:hypothetical protein